MEPNNISDVFWSFDNPTLYAILFGAIILIVILYINKEYIRPLENKRKRAELKAAKLEALYSSVDPDPVIRIDRNWKVIGMNNAAKEAIHGNKLTEQVLDQISASHEHLDENSSIKVGGKHYSLRIIKIDDTGSRHIYLHDITSRINYENKITSYQKSLKELRLRIETLNEEEKQRLGNEVHDGVGHSILLFRIELQELLNRESSNFTKEEIDNTLGSLDLIAEEIRGISHELRPRLLGEFGIVQAIRSLVDKINLQGEMKGYVSKNTEIHIEEERIERTIYRICQEALNNIIKHSECNEFRIIFDLEDKYLKITITDDGKGFDLEEELESEGSALGFLNMRERAEVIGGKIVIDSMLDMGTTIIITVKI